MTSGAQAPLLFRRGLLSMSVRACGLGLAFLSHIVLSRTLGASQYGTYVIALGWAMVLAIPARLGLDNSALRFATIYREQGQAAEFRGLIIFSLSCIAMLSLIIATALLVAKAAGLGPLRRIDWLMLGGVALIVPASAVLGWLSALIRTGNRIFASQFYEQVLRPVLLIATIGLLVAKGLRPEASHALLITAGSVVFATVGIAIHARVAFTDLRAAAASFGPHREWLSFSWTLFLMAIVQELLNQIDVILLGILADATQAAHFSAAWRLASLVPFGLVAMTTVSGPMIASAYNRSDMAELAKVARLNSRFSMLFAAAIAIPLALLGRTVLGLFGPGFEQAYLPLLILLVGGLANSFTGSVAYLLSMTGHQRVALTVVTGALLVSLLANIILIPHLGATGSAIASTLASLSWNLAMAAYVRRRLGLDATALGRPAIERSLT